MYIYIYIYIQIGGHFSLDLTDVITGTDPAAFRAFGMHASKNPFRKPGG